MDGVFVPRKASQKALSSWSTQVWLILSSAAITPGVKSATLLEVSGAGELLDKAEQQRRLEEQARDGVHDFYLMEHSPGIIIDARLKGNLARLINSSCDPNCETQKWRDAATNEASGQLLDVTRGKAGAHLVNHGNLCRPRRFASGYLPSAMFSPARSWRMITISSTLGLPTKLGRTGNVADWQLCVMHANSRLILPLWGKSRETSLCWTFHVK